MKRKNDQHLCVWCRRQAKPGIVASQVVEHPLKIRYLFEKKLPNLRGRIISLNNPQMLRRRVMRMQCKPSLDVLVCAAFAPIHLSNKRHSICNVCHIQPSMNDTKGKVAETSRIQC